MLALFVVEKVIFVGVVIAALVNISLVELIVSELLGVLAPGTVKSTVMGAVPVLFKLTNPIVLNLTRPVFRSIDTAPDPMGPEVLVSVIVGVAPNGATTEPPLFVMAPAPVAVRLTELVSLPAITDPFPMVMAVPVRLKLLPTVPAGVLPMIPEVAILPEDTRLNVPSCPTLELESVSGSVPTLFIKTEPSLTTVRVPETLSFSGC
jgi:hypothetical protein